MGVYDGGYRDTYDLDRGVYKSAYEVIYNPKQSSSGIMSDANFNSFRTKKNPYRSQSESESESSDSSDSEDERIKRKAKAAKKEGKEKASKKKSKKKAKQDSEKEKKKSKKANKESKKVSTRHVKMMDPYGMYFYQP